MTDVDAIRWMASEHDLEFVDLDTYGVDPAAGEILPVSLSRQHHVVAIKRKFGTPVIATADPDDVSAQDTVRASIGRDFISVVASRDQIGDYLERLYGSEDSETQFEQPDIGDEVEDVYDLEVADLANFGADTFAPDPKNTQIPDADVEVPTPEEPEAPTNGKRHRRDGAKSKIRKSASSQVVETSDGPDGGNLDARTLDITPVDRGGNIDSGEPSALNGLLPMSLDESLTVPQSAFDLPAAITADTDEGIAIKPPVDAPEQEDSEVDLLEPATALLPEFGTNSTVADLTASSKVLAAGVDELAELALSVQDDGLEPNADSTDLAADLVAEAVATYQEQQGDEPWDEAFDVEAPTGAALFPPLAKALVDGERVSLADMEIVLDEHYRSGHSIAHILTAEKLVTEADLMWGMAQEMGLEFVDLDTVGVSFTEAGIIPEATARHHNVIVIGNDNGTPVVAASNPTDVFAMDDLRTIMGRNFIVVVATRTQISSYIGQAFNSGGDAADMAMEASLGFDGSGRESSVDDIQSVTEEAPIVRYVNLLILQALNERASDIHIEPTATDLRIRYRIDGVLHDVSTAPRAISAAVTTRLKVMSDMNVAEHRIPQDGRISLNVGSKGIDLRMATLPTIHGEKVVMRVLDKSSVVLGFADLGFDEDLLHTYESIYTKPYGTILVTGPTGSGKSTTLYTTLTALNSPEKNIITVEDPVELPLKGVNQVQLNVKAGLNFASALKAILRSDPDIVLVGEIRDKETAVIVIEAALTGHMVLSTLHTNSAASTPMRLIEMGIEPFLVTSSLSGVLAQRLTRRLCMHCKEAYEPTEADIVAAGWTLEEVEAVGGMSKVFRSVGCSACANTGYRGRKALSELMPMTEEIERLIIEGGSVEDIHKLAVAQGMLTLRQSGLRKAMEGETTLEEVLRVVA
jgi:type IV pilus assembly protein PilB